MHCLSNSLTVYWSSLILGSKRSPHKRSAMRDQMSKHPTSVKSRISLRSSGLPRSPSITVMSRSNPDLNSNRRSTTQSNRLQEPRTPCLTAGLFFGGRQAFGRRPPERVDSPAIPASENLHNSGNRRLIGSLRRPLPKRQHRGLGADMKEAAN
jgi:hypothetical protein